MMRKSNAIAGVAASFFVAMAGLAGSATFTVAAAQEEEGERQTRRSETLDPAVAKVLQEVFTAIQEERFQDALTMLNNLLAQRGDRMKAYDRGTTYEMRASVKVNLEDYRGALRDFQAALDSGGLPPERNNQLRYYIAQLYFQLEDYQSAINGLQAWIAAEPNPDPNAFYLLAAAHVQLGNFRAALNPAERAVAAMTGEPRKSYFDLLNLVYSETGERNKRAALLERMINHWPSERAYWTQLSGLYNQMGRDADAFAVLEVAYRAGLLKTESEILTLVQYFSFYDNPFRGAKLLEREMGAGAVKRNVKNLTLLSQLWSQAREHKRAIPVLQEASRMSDTGVLSYRLGQVLLADEQYGASERALREALRKGGMTSTQTGDSWLLLGTAIFAQAGPEDRAIRRRARDAFVNAQRYSNTQRQAKEWVTYIDAIRQVEIQQDYLECQQRGEARKADIERLTTQAQVCRLQGGTTECDPLLEQIAALKKETETDICSMRPREESGPSILEEPVNAPQVPATPEEPAAPETVDE